MNCPTPGCANLRIPRRRTCAVCTLRPQRPRDTVPDSAWAGVCLSCYLPGCWQNGYLGQYCPVNVARRFGLSAPITLELSQAATPNRRWWFVEQAREAGAAK